MKQTDNGSAATKLLALILAGALLVTAGATALAATGAQSDAPLEEAPAAEPLIDIPPAPALGAAVAEALTAPEAEKIVTAPPAYDPLSLPVEEDGAAGGS